MSESWPIPSDAELVRYLAGESDVADARAIEQWLVGASEHRRRLEDLRLVWQATAAPPTRWDPARSWAHIAEHIEQPRRPMVVREQSKAGVWWRRALVAAGIGGVMTLGWYAQREITGGAARDREVAALVERRTSRGERATFPLPDGTEVMLGPESRLRYSSTGYNRRDRAVELVEGYGYFKVVHNAARPFAVRTSAAMIRDLGTRFTVLARTGRPVEVGVAEGRVAIGRAAAPSDSVVLDRGDAAQVMESGQLDVQRRTDIEHYFAWTEGRLSFRRSTLRAVVDELERWYDVDIRLAEPGLERRVFTGGFENRPVGDVLGFVAAALGLTISGSGRHFVVSGR